MTPPNQIKKINWQDLAEHWMKTRGTSQCGVMVNELVIQINYYWGASLINELWIFLKDAFYNF